MRPIRRIFVSKANISHFLKLVDLVFQQAGTVLTRLSRSSFRTLREPFIYNSEEKKRAN
jgi:hypothetical protein